MITLFNVEFFFAKPHGSVAIQYVNVLRVIFVFVRFNVLLDDN